MVLGSNDLNIGGVAVYQTIHCPAGPYHFSPGNLENYCDIFHYWSLHSGGANFLMVDGSVRFISYNGTALISTLATRAGGELPVLDP
ncbi:MAG: DUF1559 domain-containing protein [Gemmataceae bacterium]|nr:DUF1559 domain-containing protein [Gemmataceae bacterium]